MTSAMTAPATRKGIGVPFLRERLRSAFDMPLGPAGVDLPRPGDPWVRIEQPLLPLREPARRAPDGEEHREHLDREAHGLVDEARVEVDVRVELVLDEVLVLERDLLELERDVEQWVAARHGEDLLGDALDQASARVVGLVHAVTEPHA